MLKRVVLAAVVAILPTVALAQPIPRFEILSWIDGQWTVIDSHGAFVRTLPIAPAEPPAGLSLSYDGTKLLFIIRNWQTWEHDLTTGQSRLVSQADWNSGSNWLPGSTSEFTFNDASGRVLKFNTLTGDQSLWQANDTIDGRVYTRVMFDGTAQRSIFNIHYGGAGGMGVYLGDVCFADASHALCNVRPLAWPGNGSTSWADVAANGVLNGDGSRAVYVERHSTNGAVYLHDIPTDTRVALLNWSASPEAGGSVFGLFENRYAVVSAQSITQPNDSAFYVCDIEDQSCNEILIRPYSLGQVVVARSFGDTTPPVINGPGDVTIEATGSGGAVVEYEVAAVDDIDGAVEVDCVPASGETFGIQTTPVVCSATDRAGNTADLTFNVTVVDTTPPSIVSIAPSHEALWPPNHKMVDVSLVVSVSDVVVDAPECHISTVEATAPLDGNDWIVTGALTASLRATRPGTGDTAYTLTVSCSDGTNPSTATVTVAVPHDQRQ